MPTCSNRCGRRWGRWINVLGTAFFLTWSTLFIIHSMQATRRAQRNKTDQHEHLHNNGHDLRHVASNNRESPPPVYLPVGFEGFSPKKPHMLDGVAERSKFYEKFAVGVKAFRDFKLNGTNTTISNIEISIAGQELTWLSHFQHILFLGDSENPVKIPGHAVVPIMDDTKEDFTDLWGPGGIPPWINRKDEKGHFFFLGLRLLYRKFPHSKWYMLVNGDAYVFAENLAKIKTFQNSNKAVYMGSAHVFRGCAGVKEFGKGPKYAGGVAPIILSRAAMKLLFESNIVGDCMADYNDCYGDVRLALCLQTLGIKMEANENFQRSSIAHVDKDPVWNSAFTMHPCSMPLSFPDQTLQSMLSLRDAENAVKSWNMSFTYASLRSIQLAANPTLFKTVTWADKDFTRNGFSYLRFAIRSSTSVGGPTGIVDCARMCEIDERCKSWRVEPKSICCLMKETGKKVFKAGYYCGEPYVCRHK